VTTSFIINFPVQ